MNVLPKIFREYDIRGIAGDELNRDTARLIGWAFARYLLDHNHIQASEAGELTIAVGRDVRLHSAMLSNGLIDGITATGARVVDVGVCPTPLLYFTLYNMSADGGIMITGSHNPPEFNGFKICAGKEAMHGDSIQELRRIIEKDKPDFDKANAARMIENVEYNEIAPFYLSYLREQFVFPHQALNPPVKVVVDSGNGTAGIIAPVILREMGCEVIELYSQPDGRFPNHHPDPTIPENLEALIRAVRENEADLGVAYDGDADRIGVVDEKGEIIWGDRLMIIYAREILKEWPGAPIVSEVKASQVLYDEIEKSGGVPVMWKAGHSLIKAKMREDEAVLGGEVSGHIFFADRFFGYDDAIYATCRLIEIIRRERFKAVRESRVQKGISYLLDDVASTHTTPEIRIDCPDEKKFNVVEKIQEIFSSEDKKTGISGNLRIKDVITVDGVRVVFEGGWGLIRSSNTQPVLVLRYEADSEERLQDIRSFMEALLNKVISEVS